MALLKSVEAVCDIGKGVAPNLHTIGEASLPLLIEEHLNGTGRCPHCNVAEPLLTKIWAEFRKNPGNMTGRAYALYQCSRCNRITMAEGVQVPLDASGAPASKLYVTIAALYPPPSLIDPSLPADARRYLKQSLETLHAPDASIVMAASAVDAMLKAKGYTSGNLYPRIEKAVEDHVLTEGMAQWAHKVRLEANAVRHADAFNPEPSMEDAKQVLEFATALGDFLFVFTARVAEGIQSAEAAD